MISPPKYAVPSPDTNPDSVSGFDHHSPAYSGIPTNIPTKCRDSRSPGKDAAGNPPTNTTPHLTVEIAASFSGFGYDRLTAGQLLELPGKNPLKDAHANLDSAVLAAYHFNPSSDLLAQLLSLNLQLAANLEANQPVTPPASPHPSPTPIPSSPTTASNLKGNAMLKFACQVFQNTAAKAATQTQRPMRKGANLKRAIYA